MFPTYATSGNDNSNLCLGWNTQRFYGKFMFVDVLLFLEYVIQIPNFNASINWGGYNTIFIPGN